MHRWLLFSLVVSLAPSGTADRASFRVQSTTFDARTNDFILTFNQPVDLESVNPESVSIVDQATGATVPFARGHATSANDVLIRASVPMSSAAGYTLALNSRVPIRSVDGEFVVDKELHYVVPFGRGGGGGSGGNGKPPDPIQISAGAGYTCATRVNGTLMCWGDNTYGAVGVALADGTPILEPTAVPTVSPVARLCGAVFIANCALSNTANPPVLFMWGANMSGQLGVAGNYSRFAPLQPNPNVQHPVDVATNGQNTCALRADGKIFCTGQNGVGMLGLGFAGPDIFGFTQPVVDPGPFTSVTMTGQGGACALKTDSTVWCWGDNTWGESGDGKGGMNMNALTLVPVQPVGLPKIRALAASWGTVCALALDGTVWCWGIDLGLINDPMKEFQNTPVQKKGLTNIVSMSMNRDAGCGIDINHDAWCWGADYVGQLGDGQARNVAVPTPIKVARPDGGTFLKLVVGFQHVCGLVTPQYRLYCWGDNSAGAFGIGKAAAGASLPTQSHFVP